MSAGDLDRLRADAELLTRSLKGASVLDPGYADKWNARRDLLQRIAELEAAPPPPSEYVVFDFETTGLSANECDVIQISAIRFSGGTKESFNRFLQIGYTVPAAAAAVHGIDNALLDAEGVAHAEGWADFAEFIGADAFVQDATPLVGHNIVNFDCKFLEVNFKRWGLPLPDKERYFDTAMVYKGKKLGQLPMEGEPHHAYCLRMGAVRARGVYYKLALICEELGIDVSEYTAHRADGDVEMTNLIYLAHLSGR